MDDNQITALFLARDEAAVDAVSRQYGAYCAAIARNILGDPGAAEECVNDTWLKCWQSIPPQRPASLKCFVGRIVRNLAVSALRADRAAKRGGGQGAAVLDELAQLLPGGEEPEEALDRADFRAAFNGFLAGLGERDRTLFLRRYWYADSVEVLALRLGMSRTAVTTALHRLRQKLRQHLQWEDFNV